MSGDDHIPIADLRADVVEHWDEYADAIANVLRSAEFVLGGEVGDFEAEIASYLQARHAIGVNSGTDALVLALRALGIGEGHEVITSPFTFFATAEAISSVGATPVFVDIDPVTFNIDPNLIPAAIGSRTKAILPVHLFGLAAPLEEIDSLARDRNLMIIEDAAQALGAESCHKKVGTIGNVGAYSFFPTKNLGGFGDGGLVTTDDDELAHRVRMLRVHGGKSKYHNEMIGYNSRLDAVQAAILRVKLPRLDAMNEGRRRVARRYDSLLADISDVVTPAAGHSDHVYHQYTVRVANGRRDDVAATLREQGIETMVYYPVPVHRLPVYRDLNASCPVAEQAANEVLSLPIWPTMPEGATEKVTAALKTALGG